MFYNYNSIFILVTEKTGGLFDFDGTLPVIGLQFIFFMFILNFILYNPLLDTIDERNTYIKKSLDEATNVLTNANQLNVKYENKASKARKAAKLDWTGKYQRNINKAPTRAQQQQKQDRHDKKKVNKTNARIYFLRLVN